MEGFKIMIKMRRQDKELGSDEAIKLLTDCEYGVLRKKLY